jgi:hypothetical protein
MFKPIVFRTLKILGIIFGALLIFSVVINIFFKEQMIQYLLNQINKQVNAKIEVQDPDFSFWRSFPNASIEFGNVVVHPSNEWVKQHEGTDTLLFSSKLIFEFNIINLLSGSYVINKIRVHDGQINLKVDETGKLNYDIFKKGQGKGTTLSLKDIVLRRCSVKYSNQKADVFISTFTSKTHIGGTIKTSIFDFQITTDADIYSLFVHKENYVKNRAFSATLGLYVANNSYHFNNVSFSLDKLRFLFQGQYDVGSTDLIQFKFSGDKLNLAQLIGFFPEKYAQTLSNYSAKGIIRMDVSIFGKISSIYDAQLTVSCSLNKSTVTEKKSGIKLEDLTFDGTFTNGQDRSRQSSVILVNRLSGKIGFGDVSLSGKLTNLNKPYIEVNGISKIEINDLKEFFKLDTFEILKGKIDGTFAVKAIVNQVDRFKFSNVDIENMAGSFSVNNVDVKLKDSQYKLQSINGLISLANDISFNNITFKLNESELRLTGRLINGLPYLLNRTDDATIEAELFSHSIDLSAYFNETGKKSADSRELLFPAHLNLDLKLNVNEFIVNKFKARWLKGYLQYKPTMFIFKSLSFDALEGNLKGNGVIVQDMNHHFNMKGQVDVSKVNIQQAFYTFNNFSQDIVQDRHLRGRLSGKVDFTSEWTSNLTFIPESLIVDANIVINNGQLVNFEPMNGLSRFISLEELKDIKFSTLKNSIYIKDKQLIIPDMDINSSAFNISGSGIHYFDNHYQYKVKVLLSEVLSGKARKAKKENEEYGRIEDDGLGKTSIYLSVVGFGKDYKITYDSKKTLDIVKESLIKQKRELKGILHDEFGWFKNDSTLKSTKKPATNAVQVQFDDETETTATNKKADPTIAPATNKKKEASQKVEVEWE